VITAEDITCRCTILLAGRPEGAAADAASAAVESGGNQK